jgi:hypothetical protein
MNTFWKVSLPCLSLAALLSGCGSKPELELSQTEEARAEALEQRAQEFAPVDWERADQLFQEAKGLIEKQSYGQARSALLRAKDRFRKTRDIAKGKRDDILRETQGIQKTIDLRYAALKTSIEQNSQKLSAANRKSLEASCTEIDQGIDKLKAELDQGEYVSAKNSAQVTVRKVYEAEVQLQKYLGIRPSTEDKSP